MRKLATIRLIDDIQPIPNADAIEVATVGGWQVVVKKNEFKVNDFVLYLEIDSFIPQSLVPFLSQYCKLQTFEGVDGYRLRTKRMRGVYSQGLLLPLDYIFDVIYKNDDLFLNITDFDQLNYEDNHADRNIHNTQ